MVSPWKTLLKTPATIETLSVALAELETDGPRGAVILGATLIEQILRGVLSYHMVTLTDEEFNQLFRNMGPLSSFSARTRVAYAFNFIGPKTRDDIDRLRELRNGFAHTGMALSFETPEVIAEIKQFNCLSGLLDKDKLTTRELFKATVRLLMIHLIAKISPELDVGEDIRDFG